MTSATDTGLVQCLPWESLLEYEQVDIIRATVDVLSCSFLQRDDLSLVEREQVESVSDGEPLRMNSLLLRGRVGHTRREAVLSLVRGLRLKHVADLATSVTVGCVPGDTVPHMMLEPLTENAHVRSYRRWHMARSAMRAGLLRRIQERREQMRSRLRFLLRSASDPASSHKLEGVHITNTSSKVGNEHVIFTATSAEESSAVGKNRRPDFPLSQSTDLFAADITELVGDDTSASNRASQAKRLALFEAGVRETRVDVWSIAATVPTVFVVWSYLYDECMAWMRAQLFNASAAKDLDVVEGGVPRKFGFLFGIDPWLRFVEQYVNISPRRKLDQRLQQQRVLPITAKRAQIVLVNADRDRTEARTAFLSLLAACLGWSSEEVSLMALWAGEDGLHSRFCVEVGTSNFPFVFVTEPMRRGLHSYKLKRPRVVRTDFSPCSDGHYAARPPATPAASQRPLAANSVPEEGSWGATASEARAALCAALTAKLSKAAIPLRLCARVERCYPIPRPRGALPTRVPRTEVSSAVALHGIVSDRDLRTFREELIALATVTDFTLAARVVRVSGPLVVTLDGPSPSRRVQGVRRAVACAACLALIDLDRSPHYRCVHCSCQSDATFCEACVRAQLSRGLDELEALFALQQDQRERRRRTRTAGHGLDEVHPVNHVLLRVPPLAPGLVADETVTSVTTVPLLWGAQNVRQLPRFCGRLLAGTRDTHIGVYCNRCHAMVLGVRWKCAICYTYDLCDRCFQARGLAGETGCGGSGPSKDALTAAITATTATAVAHEAAGSAQPSHHAGQRVCLHRHARWHPMLYVRYATDGEADDLLDPEEVENPLEELMDSTAVPGESATSERSSLHNKEPMYNTATLLRAATIKA